MISKIDFEGRKTCARSAQVSLSGRKNEARMRFIFLSPKGSGGSGAEQNFAQPSLSANFAPSHFSHPLHTFRCFAENNILFASLSAFHSFVFDVVCSKKSLVFFRFRPYLTLLITPRLHSALLLYMFYCFI